MALIKCEECGKPIAATASTCPSCGFNHKGARTSYVESQSAILFVLPIIIYFIVIIGGLHLGFWDPNHPFFNQAIFDIKILSWFAAPLIVLLGVVPVFKTKLWGGWLNAFVMVGAIWQAAVYFAPEVPLFPQKTSPTVAENLNNASVDLNINSSIKLPIDQQAFINQIESTSVIARNQTDSGSRKLTWIELNKDLCEPENKRITFAEKNNWIAILNETIVNDSGELKRFRVQLSDNIILALEDLKKIPPELVLKASKGASLLISGRFVEGDISENECLNNRNYFSSKPEIDSYALEFNISKISVMP